MNSLLSLKIGFLFFTDYLLSNNHVNSIIVHKFDFSDEEVMAYYISFLKTLSFRLNKHTIHFFYNEVSIIPRRKAPQNYHTSYFRIFVHPNILEFLDTLLDILEILDTLDTLEKIKNHKLWFENDFKNVIFTLCAK